MSDPQEGTNAAALTDDVEASIGGETVGTSLPSGLEVVQVEHPERGTLFVAAPVGSSTEDALALVGEPGEVKGPSAAVWGDEHAAAFDPAQAAQPGAVATPQGLGEPVKCPAENRDAAEVIDSPVE